MYKQHPQFAWLNGEIVPWDKCVIHARSQAGFWGANVFEGVRVYWQDERQQLFIYRLHDHLTRLKASMKCIDMPTKYTDQEIIQGCINVLRHNDYHEDVHIVIVAGFGFGQNYDSLGFTDDTLMHITALPFPRSARYDTGANISISTWRRISEDSMPPRVKTGANYHNSRLAHHEAVRNGFDTALFLNQRNTIAKAPGACVAMIHNGVLITPPGSSGVLEGITMDSLQKICS